MKNYGNKIFITGGNGFIGSHIMNSNTNCIKLERDTSGYVNSLKENKVLNNEPTTIIHLAAIVHSKAVQEATYKSINVDETLKLARVSAEIGIERFVFVSSVVVHEVIFNLSTPTDSVSHYALSKYNAEVGLKKISEETGIEVVIVRPTLVYGHRAPGNFRLLIRLINSVPCLPFGLVKNKRDFISVNNLADLLITCAKHPDASGHTFLASENETVSIKEFTDAIAKGLNTNLVQLPFPVSLMRLAGKLLGKSIMIEQLVGNLEVDSSNLKDILGWVPLYTMEESMAFLKEKK